MCKIYFKKYSPEESKSKLLRINFMVCILNIKSSINLFNNLTKSDLSCIELYLEKFIKYVKGFIFAL